MYSLETSLIILGMVITGTARSVGVKIFYQLGCDNPLLVALLYLLGQSLALLVYGITKCSSKRHKNNNNDATKDQQQHDYIAVVTKDIEDREKEDHGTDESTAVTDDDDSRSSDELYQLEMQQSSENDDDDDDDDNSASTTTARRGSTTGLTAESQQAVAWVHSISWQLKPLIPGLFNLANAALKWASFVFVAASIAEMLMSGLELVLSVIVARLVRKRQINSRRWTGVLVVAVGLTIVHLADLFGDSSEDSTSTSTSSLRRDHWIGALLIVGQCVTPVGQDIAEELFLQEADFPATLLLGMEGVFGLLFGIPIYLRYAPEPLYETFTNLQQSEWKLIYVIMLVFVFTVTGIFNIMTTSVTSSMTRNMWKNCRTLMVWIVGLIIFYSLGDNNLGEEWIVPDSFLILGGFLIMLSGIYVYYKHK